MARSPVMHGFASELLRIEMDALGARCTWTLRTDLKLAAFGVPRVPAVGPLRKIPSNLPSEISVTRWGLSLGRGRQWMTMPGGLAFRTQTMATTTLLDVKHVRLTFRHRVRETPVPFVTGKVLQNYARLFNGTVEQDNVSWENKVYLLRPAASKSEPAIFEFRKWARQFYDQDACEAALGRGESGAELAARTTELVS